MKLDHKRYLTRKQAVHHERGEADAAQKHIRFPGHAVEEAVAGGKASLRDRGGAGKDQAPAQVSRLQVPTQEKVQRTRGIPGRSGGFFGPEHFRFFVTEEKFR